MKNKNLWKLILMASGVVGIFILTSYLLTLGTVTLQNYLQTDTALAYGEYSPLEYKADITKEPTMKEWLKMTIKNAGISWDEASKIIDCESKGNPDAHAVNWDNMAGVDRGLWQINSLYHKEVSNECAYNYQCATFEAIKIYREWGNNWNAWSCKKVL